MMQTIWQSLKTGTAKERLAIVADLVSIAGVSIASVAGGVFAITQAAGTDSLNLYQIGAATVIGLLSLAGGVLLLALLLVVFAWLRTWQPRIAGVRVLVLTAVWLCLGALLVVATWAYYDLFSSFRFIRS
jgi:hypothetical protein